MKMKVGFYLGCLIPTEQYAYEMSLREVLPRLGVELVEMEDASCCGAPLRSINLLLTLYLSARNLALCEEKGIDVFAPCPNCHLALCEAKRTLDSDQKVRERLNSMLKEEGLKYSSSARVYHTLDLLHDKIGIEEIKKHITHPIKELKIAAHYGCHLIRPADVGRPDDSENPQKFEHILRAIGANTEDYTEKLNCCGAPIMITHPESALTKTAQKLKAVQEHAFNALATLCPWGHRMFDTKQSNASQTIGETLNMPVLYLTQLLGLAMGIEPSKLGLELNLSPIEQLKVMGGGE